MSWKGGREKGKEAYESPLKTPRLDSPTPSALRNGYLACVKRLLLLLVELAVTVLYEEEEEEEGIRKERRILFLFFCGKCAFYNRDIALLGATSI